MIKTRFAPSPTGELHIGGVRTALFAYLFAKHNKGEFLLRIEDTDRERYVKGSVERIIESLRWLGLDFDNKKPIVQSERLPLYKKAAYDLLEAGKAYICTCTKTRLAELRREQEKKGAPTGYDGKCRNIEYHQSRLGNRARTGISNIEELEAVLKKGVVVRMKMPKSGKIKFNDLIRGEVEFDLSLLDDQVILKSDGYPTYHLASVIDDHEMKMSHIIRAEEWLSSTPKHLVLFEMFGFKPPKYAHLSMILGPDKKKLSKRHGATGILDYKKEGYLSHALVNFIAFLGWNPKDEREIFTLEELIAEFKIENVNKAPAIFDLNKLNDISEKYIRTQIAKLKSQNHRSKLKTYLIDFGINELSEGEAVLIGRGGFATLKVAAEYIKKLRKKPEYDEKMLVFKKSSKENTLKGLEVSSSELATVDDWNDQEIQMRLSLIVPRNNLTNGDVFWPVRVALSGEEKSPSPVELAVALGKEETVKRIKDAIKALNK